MTLQVESAVTVRLDVWLWAARFFKTRSLAKHAVDTGKVDVAGQRPKPSRAVRTGEQLRIDRGGEIFEITVAALSEVRGPAPVAQALYTETRHRAKRARSGGCNVPPSAPGIARRTASRINAHVA